ncbi:hypothetical protein JCGZ_13626 [Jatropha curcas]|uniref:Uncharacterized protein n=1 Tax=Jatropha curcas TaxID=180498 RepID=A0A067KL90_JATCU|nr:hypothetical protein JCGZ_13626 [Jatropha curcas]
MSPRRCKSGLVTAPLRSTLMQKAVAGSCDRNSPSSLFLRSRQQRHNSMPSSPPQTTLDLTVSVPGLRFRRVRLSSMDWQQRWWRLYALASRFNQREGLISLNRRRNRTSGRKTSLMV